MAAARTLLLALLAAAAAPAAAFRKYLNYAPNADLVPCPPGASGAGCHGAAICEAWGHTDCTPLAGGTAAGLSLQASLQAKPLTGWSVQACSADNDSDGLTDGDELGDGCCSWPTTMSRRRR